MPYLRHVCLTGNNRAYHQFRSGCESPFIHPLIPPTPLFPHKVSHFRPNLEICGNPVQVIALQYTRDRLIRVCFVTILEMQFG
jgi:hypothetical protein